LQLLVIGLTLSMIVGVITVVAVVVTRFPHAAGAPALPALPETIALPEGARPQAVTWAEGWYAVVTDTGEILIYDPASGALSQRVTVEAGSGG